MYMRIGAIRGSTASGAPIQNSTPSGVATSSRKKRAERLPRDAPDELADGPAEVQHVVAVADARLPERLLVGEHARPCSPSRCSRRGATRRLERRQADGVVEHHAHRRALLAVARELGPVLGDRRVDVELAAAREHVRADRRRALRAREHDRDRVARPGHAVRRPREPAPEVDDRAPLEASRTARRRPRRARGSSSRTRPRPPESARRSCLRSCRSERRA